MTIVDELKKLIKNQGGDPSGVTTIRQAVRRLEKLEGGGADDDFDAEVEIDEDGEPALVIGT